MTPPATAAWSGTWVADRLGVALEDHGGAARLRELAGLALRRNPRRAHLLVSPVLGKHVPVRPAVAVAAGRALGRLVAHALDPAVEPVPPADLAAMFAAGPGDAVREVADAPVPAGLVLGWAETATALGHLVADVLRAPYLHSTRRPGPAAAAGFEEAHSHATTHLLTPADPGLVRADGPVVLVDDELSTGATALGTIEALQALRPRARYVLAALVDVRGEVDRDRVEAAGRRLGCRIDVVALAIGRIRLPAGLSDRAAEVVASVLEPARAAAGGAERLLLPLPAPEGARLGFGAADRAAWRSGLPVAAAALAAALPSSGRVHVLGTEEHLALPIALAAELERRSPGLEVTVSSTTRSPVVAIDEDGYAVRDAVAFPAHDAPADGPGNRFAYNLGALRPDVLVVLPDRAGDTPALAGLLGAVAGTAGRVVLAVSGS